jgi:Inner membrane protein YgaP-like, transmembrane domain
MEGQATAEAATTSKEEVTTMNANVGNPDKIARIVLGLVAAVVAFAVGAGSVLGIVLLVVAAVLIVTALTGFCPLYRVLHISTDKARAH